MDDQCVIVIPAYNPPPSFAAYVQKLIEAGFSHVIVVNDGSRTDRLPVFFKIGRTEAILLTHPENRGIGAALKTAMTYYLDHFRGKASGIITLNCDRLTPVEDVRKMAESLRNEQELGSYAIVVGSRDMGSHQVTDYDYRMNVLMKLIYHMLMGVRLTDPLSGVFGIPDLRVQHCLDVQSEGYSYETAMLMSFEKIGFLQVPIRYRTFEPGYVKARRSRDTFGIIMTVIWKFLLYSLTSLMASVVDIIMFSIFTGITFRGQMLAILYGTVLARLISASVNYLLTKHFVFHFKSDKAQKSAKSAGEFMALSAAQCLLSALTVSVLKFVLGGSAVGLKVITDMVLFFLSYKIQHKYIFKDDKKEEKEDRQDEDRILMLSADGLDATKASLADQGLEADRQGEGRCDKQGETADGESRETAEDRDHVEYHLPQHEG